MILCKMPLASFCQPAIYLQLYNRPTTSKYTRGVLFFSARVLNFKYRVKYKQEFLKMKFVLN